MFISEQHSECNNYWRTPNSLKDSNVNPKLTMEGIGAHSLVYNISEVKKAC